MVRCAGSLTHWHHHENNHIACITRRGGDIVQDYYKQLYREKRWIGSRVVRLGAVQL